MPQAGYLNILRELPEFAKGKIVFKKLNIGATSVKYLVVKDKKKYVARFLGRAQKEFLNLNQTREAYNIKQINRVGLGPKVIRLYPRHNLLLLSYIEGRPLTKGQVREAENLKRIIKLLKKITLAKRFRGNFDVINSINEYKNIVHKDGKIRLIKHVNIVRYKLAVSIIRKRKHKLIPCHVDLMHLNFIIKDKKINLIDWEYSARGDELFDLAFLSGQSRFNKKLDRFLLKNYYGKVDAVLTREFLAMKALFYLREGLWSLVQLGRSNLSFNYQDYAQKNFRWFNCCKLD